MKLVLALMILLMGAFAAAGAPETATIGPFNISFDMNTTMNYSILRAQPLETPALSIYMLQIKTNNSTLAQLSITESKNLSDSTINTDKIIVQKSLINYGYYKNISYLDR
jgi:hypothetical protein